MIQCCLGCRHRNRVMAKSACHKRLAVIEFRLRLISILPISAIDPKHVFRLTSNDANRQTTTGNLSVGYQVSFDSKPGLRSAGMNSETCNDLIEDQRDLQFFRERTKVL